jgi:sulfate permease, SulP family
MYYNILLCTCGGTAIIMTKAQLAHFKSGGKFLAVTEPVGASTYGIAALTMVLMKVIPKLTKKVPPSLGAVILSSLVAKFGGLPAKTLADVAGAETFKGGLSVLPSIGFPKVPLSIESFQVVLPYAITMAAVGLIESLLTMQLMDSMDDDGTKSSSTRECIGQGVGNMMSGLTGGIGGCILVGQSVINMQSGGGMSRWSGMSMALFLALGIVAAAPLLANVPIASLAGVMLLVCQSTFSWPSLKLATKIPKLDAFIIALVTLVTVKKDLAFAVMSGTIASALGFAWKQSTSLSATSSFEDSAKVYAIDGPLFFGSASKFSTDLFSPKTDPHTVVLDFSKSKIMDQSALEALQKLSEVYSSMGKTLQLRGLSQQSKGLLDRLYKGDSAPFKIVEDQSSPVYQPQPLPI